MCFPAYISFNKIARHKSSKTTTPLPCPCHLDRLRKLQPENPLTDNEPFQFQIREGPPQQCSIIRFKWLRIYLSQSGCILKWSYFLPSKKHCHKIFHCYSKQYFTYVLIKKNNKLLLTVECKLYMFDISDKYEQVL